MKNADNSTEILQLLESQLEHHRQRRKHHAEQMRRIRYAIDALIGDDFATKWGETEPADGYPWAATIDEIFLKHRRLSLDRVRLFLKRRGLPADDPKYAATVQGTIARKCRNGELERIGQGVYRRPKLDLSSAEKVSRKTTRAGRIIEKSPRRRGEDAK